MKFWAAIIAFMSSLFAQGFAYVIGGSRARNKVKLKGLKNKVVMLETEKEVEKLSDDDVADQLSKWVRPTDK